MDCGPDGLQPFPNRYSKSLNCPLYELKSEQKSVMLAENNSQRDYSKSSNTKVVLTNGL